MNKLAAQVCGVEFHVGMVPNVFFSGFALLHSLGNFYTFVSGNLITTIYFD